MKRKSMILLANVVILSMLLASCAPAAPTPTVVSSAETMVASDSATLTLSPTLTQTLTQTLTVTLTDLPTLTATPIPTLTPTVVLGIGSSQVSPKDGMVMVYVPKGDFLMGSTDADIANAKKDCSGCDYSSEQPQHTVTLDAFFIDRTEVTNAQYAGCVSSGKCMAPQDTSSNTRSSYYGNSTYADYPVINVDWNQAGAYCGWAGRRLPTEAEWEKAARGTDGRVYPWGDQSPDKSLLNYNSNVGETTRVGSYPSGASPYGAWDMAGNVWEWVADWYSATYYQNSPKSNPKGPDSGQYRVLRGGGWYVNGRFVRTAYRFESDPTNSNYYFGFRCAASPAP